MTTHIEATAEESAKIQQLLKAPYPVTISVIAKTLGTTDLEAAQKLPTANVSFVTGDVAARFDEIWAALAAWEKATLFVVHAGSIFEIQAKLSAGKRAQGYYNILAKDAVVGGHLKYDAISAVAFVTMPFMGRESHCVQFFAQDGSSAFSVYVGRENHQLIPSVVEAFKANKAAFCA